MFEIGDFTRPIDPSKITRVSTPAELEGVQDGEHVLLWDYIAEADKYCLRPSQLAPWRKRADPLADDAVEALDLKPGMDALAAIEKALEGEIPPTAVVRFWDHVLTPPPPGVSAFAPDQDPKSLQDTSPEAALRHPTRRPPPTCMTCLIRAVMLEVHDLREGGGGTDMSRAVAQGQAVFWRYSTYCFEAFMHFSLAGGFGSPRLAATMRETGYLTSSNRDATYRRLLETTLFILDAMSDFRIGVGKGWKSTLRVRLLHAQVRRRIRQGMGIAKEYDPETLGLPINQEDMSATLGAFAVAPLWSMRRVGLRLTREEQAAYVATWRHLGHMLGIEEDILRTYYGTLSGAEKFFASVAFDLFPAIVPEDPYQTPTYKMLSAVSNRPPRTSNVTLHLECSRQLLGDPLADQLHIPRGTWRDRVQLRVNDALARYLTEFGRLYRPGWDAARVALFRDIIQLIVLYHLGERRTLFAWRTPQQHEHKFGPDEGEDPGIEMGVHRGIEVKRRWLWILGEMVLVSVCAAAVGTGLLWGLWRTARTISPIVPPVHLLAVALRRDLSEF